MTENVRSISTSGLLHSASMLFDDRVLKITAPGGKSRGTYRLHFADRTIIASHRPKNDRAALEARVLCVLSPHCDDLPRFLGKHQHVVFQSDVGSLRASHAAQYASVAGRAALADQAVQALFRIQNAARSTDLFQTLRTLGPDKPWTSRAVAVVDALAIRGGISVPTFDRDSLIDALLPHRHRFLKWDSRSGNAALDHTGRLRWFDFEYAGMRHGAEDFAWLIADENWAVDCETMCDTVQRHLDPDHPDSPDAYMTYLSRYATIHAFQRLNLIISEVGKRGWRRKERVLHYDDVGIHPDLGLRQCQRAAALADRDPLTRPLVRLITPITDAFAAAQMGTKTLMAE